MSKGDWESFRHFLAKMPPSFSRTARLRAVDDRPYHRGRLRAALWFGLEMAAAVMRLMARDILLMQYDICLTAYDIQLCCAIYAVGVR